MRYVAFNKAKPTQSCQRKKDAKNVNLQDTTPIREAFMRHLTVTNVIDLLNESCDKYGPKNCLGTRRILRVSPGTFNGRPMKKVTKEDQYQWLTFEQTRSVISEMNT